MFFIYLLKPAISDQVSLLHGDYLYKAEPPILLPYAVLLNANRIGSMGKRARLGVHSKFQIVRLPVAMNPPYLQSAKQHMERDMGINIEMLVSELQTHLLSIM